jgi:hypothetical protein
MDITQYTGYFHDGSLLNIEHEKNNVVFTMVSAEMDQEDILDDAVLSKDDRIRGKLHLEGVKSITVSKNPFLDVLKKTYDNGRIFDFEINKNFVELCIDWINYPPKPRTNEFEVIRIEAMKIYWENIPDLSVY